MDPSLFSFAVRYFCSGYIWSGIESDGVRGYISMGYGIFWWAGVHLDTTGHWGRCKQCRTSTSDSLFRCARSPSSRSNCTLQQYSRREKMEGIEELLLVF